MIEKIDFEINTKDMTEAQISRVCDKEDSVLFTPTQTMTGKRKEISGKDWRLVHDDVKVIGLIEGIGITYTLEKVEEYKTEALALAAIELLHLDDSVLHLDDMIDIPGVDNEK